MPRYLVTLGIEEFVPESGKVTEVVYDEETETIIIEYEEDGDSHTQSKVAIW